MGSAEIASRVRDRLQAGWESLGLGLARRPAVPEGASGHPWLQEVSCSFEPQVYLEAADRVLAGRFDIFASRNLELGFPPSWNRDPKTGTMAPMCFGKTLNYRDECLVGDIKYLWEPNRHLELVTLAQAWHLSRDDRYATGCRSLLESWFEQCPYPMGPNWVSSLEHAVRLVNWSFAWHLLGGEASPLFKDAEGGAFRRRWLDSIYQHCHFIRGHFSRHSSANNHLLGEYMGLFVAAVTWPLWKETGEWRDLAHRGFQEQILIQNARDGVNLEQGIWYHHEVADMMLICLLVGRANGGDFSSEFMARLESMLEFVSSLMDCGGNVPMIGDSDDAVMVRFYPGELNVYRSLLATGAVLFNRGEFKAKAGGFDDKSRWLLGDDAAHTFESLEPDTASLPVRREFPDGGYSVLGSGFETPDEVRLVADAGPLGYLSIAAHGHADALAFTLSVAGNEILIDPGTYAYHTQKRWRDYFRGTSAHNTLRVDYQDQSVPGGNFLWLRHARARCLSFEQAPDGDHWLAKHDGYTRLKDPVRHEREINYDENQKIIKILDRIKANGSHWIELHWHFSEYCGVEIQDSVVSVRNSGVSIEMGMPDSDWRPELVRGQEEPPLGWISRGFDKKKPAPCVRWAGSVSGSAELCTEIRIELKQ